MHAIEIHTIILIMSAPMTWGLLQHLQNCSDYCKLLSNQSNNTRWDCDCSAVYQYKVRPTTQGRDDATPIEIEDREIVYNLVKNNSQYSSPHFKPKVYLGNSVTDSKTTDIEPNIFKTRQNHRRYEPRNISKNSEQSLDEIITKNDIPLYLDIDVYETTKNKTNHEVIGELFENFRFIERNLSECLNLHIFLFSKNIDNNNKTNTNWDRYVNEYDKLSNSEELTEIKNKCNQTGNLVKQSVYDIKTRSANGNPKFSKEASHETLTAAKFKPSNEIGASISHVNTISVPDLYKDISELEEATPWVTAATLEKDITDEIYDRLETQLNNTRDNKNSNTIDKYFNERLNISNDEKNLAMLTKLNRSVEQTESAETNINSTVETNTQYTDSDYLNKYGDDDVTITLANDKTTNNYFENTITNTPRRGEYQEGEYLIPKVVTKELPNNVQSVVEGYEVIPNSDYINQRTTPMVLTTELSQTVTELYPEHNIDVGQFTSRTVSQAKGVEIEGHLYFLYGKHQIPARFIQEQDGNIHLAVDGFSLCEKILQQKNKSAFMSLFCKCIVLKICTQK